MFSLIKIQEDEFVKNAKTIYNKEFYKLQNKEKRRILDQTLNTICQNIAPEYSCLKCIVNDELIPVIDKNQNDETFMKGFGCVFHKYFNRNDMFRSFMDLSYNYDMKHMKIAHKDVKYVISINSKQKDELFLLKGTDNVDEITNEAFVAICGTNNLRHLIPNFSYIFSFNKCPNDLEIDKTPILWNEYPTRYCVIYEKIVGTALRKLTINSDCICYFMQILYALAIAEQMIGFTHYDLHDENVIVKHLIHPIQITYKKRDGTPVYIVTTGIASIIDYEFSTISYNDKKYGDISKNAGVYPRTFALYDCLKLTYYQAESSNYYKNIEVYEFYETVYKFFSDDNLIDVISARKSYNAYLPYIDKFKNKTVYDLIEYIENIYSFDFMYSIEKLPIVDRQIYSIDHYLANPIDNVRNVFEYYDLYIHLNSIENSAEYLRKLHTNFILNEDESKKLYSDIVKEFNRSNDINFVEIKLLKITDLLYNTYVKYISDFAKYYSLYTKMVYYTEAIEKVFILYMKNIPEITNVKMQLNLHYDAIKRKIDSLDKDLEYLKEHTFPDNSVEFRDKIIIILENLKRYIPNK